MRVSRRWHGLGVALVVPALIVVYAVDPAQHALTLPCPYKTLTGWACPGCGLTRALHALLHGNLRLAFSFNPWVFVGGPAAAAFALLPRTMAPDRAQGLRTALAWVMLAITLAFWVWRNTASYPLLRV